MIRVHEAAFLPADFQELSPVEVNFGSYLQLVGVRLERDLAGVLLGLHWRSLRQTHRHLRCFAHLLEDGKQVSALDHNILRNRPPISRWTPGEEGFERLRLWRTSLRDDLKLRLGIYDPQINVRQPVLASTLPVVDESSAILIGPDVAAGSTYTVKFDAPAPASCRILFDGGLELTAYAVVSSGNLVWLQLHWTLRKAPRGIRFFGHVVATQDPETAALAQFDQDLAPAEQNIVRALALSGPVFVRAGLFRPSNLKRLKIRSSTAAMDDRARCVYLPLHLNQ